MNDFIYLAYFFGGAFLANGIPHFLQGISGNRFQSPFASPPGVGESSPLVNAVWGMLNFVISYLLLDIGEFDPGPGLDLYIAALGFVLMALVLAWHFGRVRNP
ncbi:MAG: hypothetical protein JXB38_15505 [Anaerolineales bacterium]|nr:hypothetical protein [Anaerolineales bacterium]